MKTNEEYISFSTPVSLDCDGRTLTGTIPYGVYGSFAYGAINKLAQGCFSSSFGREIWALFNHDWDSRLARTSNDSLKLTDTAEGLQIEIKVPDTPTGNQFLAEYKAGLIDGFSFGGPKEKMIRRDETERGKKSITSFALQEVSPVYVPVFAGDIEVYSADSQILTSDESEKVIIEETKEEEVKIEQIEQTEEKKPPMELLRAIQKLAELYR